MDSNLNTTDAFKSVYENQILHNYINYLYGAATLNFDFNLLLKPLDWCKEYIGQLVPVLEYSTLERNCDDHLGRVYFRFNVSSEEAFQHAYFNIVKKNVLDDVYYVARMYYEYLLDAFLPYIDPVAKGPSEYCDPNNPRNVALTNTSFDSQVIPIATTHYFMDQSQIAEFSGSQNLYQYQNPENGPKLSLEFTSGISEINTARKNHLDIDLNQSVYYDTQEGNEYIYQDYNRPSGSTSAAIERNTITNNLVDIDLNLLSAMSLEQFSNTYNDDVPFQPHSNTFKPSKSREIDLNTVPEDYMNIDYSNNE